MYFWTEDSPKFLIHHLTTKDLHTFGHEDPATLWGFSEHCCYGYFLWSKNRNMHITDLTLFRIQLTTCMFCSFVVLIPGLVFASMVKVKLKMCLSLCRAFLLTCS